MRAIVCDTRAAIIAILLPEVFPAPTRATWERSEEAFRTQWNFPNCVAALDGKHVVIQAPSNSGSELFNYNKSLAVSFSWLPGVVASDLYINRSEVPEESRTRAFLGVA